MTILDAVLSLDAYLDGLEDGARPSWLVAVACGDEELCVYTTHQLQAHWLVPHVWCGYRVLVQVHKFAKPLVEVKYESKTT